jgi:hypothetical protein
MVSIMVCNSASVVRPGMKPGMVYPFLLSSFRYDTIVPRMDG